MSHLIAALARLTMPASGIATAPLYLLGNPANYVDSSGLPVLLLIAAIAVAVLGAVGAAANRVKTWDEFLLWVIGGAIGGVLAVFGWTGIILGASALFGFGVSVATAATIGLIIFGTAGLLGAVVSPLLDTRTARWRGCSASSSNGCNRCC